MNRSSASADISHGKRRFSGPRARLWITALAAMAILSLLAVVSVLGRSGQVDQKAAHGVAAASDPTTLARLATQRRIPGDPLALGEVTAPVVVAEWGDFQCPFCRGFYEETQPALISHYVDAGRVRFEWHDLAKIGPESVLAARAARAAGRQGRFWEFHDALYGHQAPENTGALTTTTLTSMATGLGLNTEQFARDVTDPTIAAQVDDDRRNGLQLGITHVPSFLVNGTVLFGAQSDSTFSQAIDSALAQGH